jgi:hypothetical protein
MLLSIYILIQIEKGCARNEIMKVYTDYAEAQAEASRLRALFNGSNLCFDVVPSAVEISLPGSASANSTSGVSGEVR